MEYVSQSEADDLREEVAELKAQLSIITAERDTLKKWMYSRYVDNLHDILEAVEAVKNCNIASIYEWLGKRE